MTSINVPNSHLGNHFSPLINIFITLPTSIQRLWPRLLLHCPYLLLLLPRLLLQLLMLLLLLQLGMLLHWLRRTRLHRLLSPQGRLSIGRRWSMLHPLHHHLTLLLLLRNRLGLRMLIMRRHGMRRGGSRSIHRPRRHCQRGWGTVIRSLGRVTITRLLQGTRRWGRYGSS